MNKYYIKKKSKFVFMLKKFNDFVKKEKLFNKKESILLAVSGGADSVAMCELFKSTGIRFSIAHCNFKLRGKESNDDEIFVKKLSEKYNVEFYSTSFETENHAKKEGISIQMAARDLRYKWFEEIKLKHNFAYIAIAHHQDDVIETFFINLLRGTGISGLHGILPKNGFLIRPLLFTNKEQILHYCSEKKINFREDSSNSSVKYIRNKIRHNIIPVFKEINPSYKDTLINNIENLKIVESIYNDHLNNKAKLVLEKTDNKIFISIKEIVKLNYKANYLYEFLKPYNFKYSTIEDIINSFNDISGKVFYSSTHRLLRDRKNLIVEENCNIENLLFYIQENTKKTHIFSNTINFKIKKSNKITDSLKTQSIAVLDYDKLKFPLTIRKWQKGDWFYPLGMNSKKKLSDYFIDNKITVFEKEKILVLCSGNDIVWVIGHRINNHYKIVQETKKMYIAQVL